MSPSARSLVPHVLARLAGCRPGPAGRPRSRFDSADPDELVRRLETSDRFCRDTREVSFREITRHDSLHVTVRAGREVATHVDRHSPLARCQPGGRCRYSPRRVAAHNVTGALNDVLRLTLGRPEDPARHLVDDAAMAEMVTSKETSHRRTGPPRARTQANERRQAGELAGP